jgi:hypothetical protein
MFSVMAQAAGTRVPAGLTVGRTLAREPVPLCGPVRAASRSPLTRGPRLVTVPLGHASYDARDLRINAAPASGYGPASRIRRGPPTPTRKTVT